MADTELLAGEHPSIVNPLAAKPPHFAAKAKSVIFLMMAGGPSQMETFDPKPELNKLAGQKMPESFGKIPAQFTDVTRQPLLALQIEIQNCGHREFQFRRRFLICRNMQISWRSSAVVGTTRLTIRPRNTC